VSQDEWHLKNANGDGQGQESRETDRSIDNDTERSGCRLLRVLRRGACCARQVATRGSEQKLIEEEPHQDQFVAAAEIRLDPLRSQQESPAERRKYLRRSEDHCRQDKPTPSVADSFERTQRESA
jgi:hypothetical protein